MNAWMDHGLQRRMISFLSFPPIAKRTSCAAVSLDNAADTIKCSKRRRTNEGGKEGVASNHPIRKLRLRGEYRPVVRHRKNCRGLLGPFDRREMALHNMKYIYGFKWISLRSTLPHRLAFPLGSKGSRTVRIPAAINNAPET